MSLRAEKNNNFGFPTSSDTNQPVQSQKQARSLRFWIYEEEGLFYPCSENKDADQLCSYCTADLRLCFRMSRFLVFWCSGANALTTADRCHKVASDNHFIQKQMDKTCDQ